MSTRSHIGLLNEDGSVREIYCHFDGDSVGQVLNEHFACIAKINALLDLGNLSSIGAEIGEKL